MAACDRRLDEFGLDEELLRQAASGGGPAYGRRLPGGRWVFVYYELFRSAKLGVGRRGAGCLDECWQYQDRAVAVAAARSWDGVGEPEGWTRHWASGRRRPDGDPAREYVRE